jgi:hypothetical protein
LAVVKRGVCRSKVAVPLLDRAGGIAWDVFGAGVFWGWLRPSSLGG